VKPGAALPAYGRDTKDCAVPSQVTTSVAKVVRTEIGAGRIGVEHGARRRAERQPPAVEGEDARLQAGR
jgi:hypothetical protein